MAQDKKAPSIAEARRLATAARKKSDADRAAEKAAADKKAAAPSKKKKSSSFIDTIRRAFSSEDDIKRIDSAVDAVSQGVADADEDNK